MINTILWADDFNPFLDFLRIYTENHLEEFKHNYIYSSHNLIHIMSKYPPDLLITDFSILEYQGIKLYEEFKLYNPDQKMWLFTGAEDITKDLEITKFFSKTFIKSKNGLDEIEKSLKEIVDERYKDD